MLHLSHIYIYSRSIYSSIYIYIYIISYTRAPSAVHLQWQPRLPCYFMLTYIRVFHPQYIGNGNPADPLPLYADVYNFWMHACPSPVTVTISPFKIFCTILRRRWLLVNSQSAAASLFCRCSGRRCEQLPCKQHAEQSPLPRRSALDRRPCLPTSAVVLVTVAGQ